VLARRQRDHAERVMLSRIAKQVNEINIRPTGRRFGIAAIAGKAEPAPHFPGGVRSQVANLCKIDSPDIAEPRQCREVE